MLQSIVQAQVVLLSLAEEHDTIQVEASPLLRTAMRTHETQERSRRKRRAHKQHATRGDGTGTMALQVQVRYAPCAMS